jgi:hypothetical protein
MAIEATIADPTTIKHINDLLPPGAAPVRPEQLPPAPTAEQREAVDALFAQESQQQSESEEVLGVIGLWAGTVMLHDLAVEHLRSKPEEEEEKPHVPRKEEDEE